MYYVGAKGSTSYPNSNIIYGSNFKVTITKISAVVYTYSGANPNTYTQLQKSVILGTCSIVRNFLNYK